MATTGFTAYQVLRALVEHAGVRISRERLRQFRDGGIERKRNAAGGRTLREYRGWLRQGADWVYDRGIIYTEAGARRVLERYGLTGRALTAAVRGMAEYPRRARPVAAAHGSVAAVAGHRTLHTKPRTTQ